MSKNKLNLLVDVLGYLCMVALASTGLILLYRLPPGTGGRHSGEPALTLLGLGRHDWGDIHFYIAVTLLLLVVLHVVLHWKWVKNTFGSLFGRQGVEKPGAGPRGGITLTVLGLVGACLIAAPWLLAVGQAERGERGSNYGKGGRTQLPSDESDAGDPREDAGRSHSGDPGRVTEPQAERGHEEHDLSITGRSTLAEAAQMAGVPVERLMAELKLPPNTPPGERLGHLRRQHGFTMSEARNTIARLREVPKGE